MNHTFLFRFPKQLGYWAIHGFCNAMPSLIIALGFLNFSKNSQAVLAMFLAIAVFIVAFAVVTSLPSPFAETSSILARSIRLGTAIRSWIAGLSLLLLLGGYPNGSKAFLFIPDIWCGALAFYIQNGICNSLGLQSGRLHFGAAGRRFLPVFTVSLLEGLIISIFILTISFFCLIILQARERRKFLRSITAPMPR